VGLITLFIIIWSLREVPDPAVAPTSRIPQSSTPSEATHPARLPPLPTVSPCPAVGGRP
jgi:hypothetical protein